MKIDFYEVVNNKGKWMGNYSPKLDNIFATSAFQMARINCSHCDGEIFEVSTVDGEQKRTKIWPKGR